MSTVRVGRAILAAVFVLAMPLAAAAEIRYTATKIDSFFANDVISLSFGYGLNNSGQAVGYCQIVGGIARAFLYSGGTVHDLATLGGDESTAAGINDLGQVTGWAMTTAGDKHAFLYASPGPMQDLGALGAASRGFAINASGLIVGDSNASRACKYDGAWHDLNTLADRRSVAYDVNASGRIVGSYQNESDIERAYLIDGAALTGLGDLGGPWSYATAVNASGLIVGTAAIDFTDFRGFTWSGPGSMAPLPTLGGPAGWAFDVNAAGDIVGRAATASGESHAYIYSGGTIEDLNDLVDPALGYVLTEARAINDNGWILCNASKPGSDEDRAFLLAPVPEPATFSLLGVGLLPFILTRRPVRPKS